MSIRIKRLKPKEHAVEPFVEIVSGTYEIRSLAEYRIQGKFLALMECRYTSKTPVNGSRAFSRTFMPQTTWSVIIMDEMEGIGNRKVPLSQGSLDNALVLSQYLEKPDHHEVRQVIRTWVSGEMNGILEAVGAPAHVFDL